MPSIAIENKCIIGCEAIITHSIIDNLIVVGVLANAIESIQEYSLTTRANLCI